MLQVEAEAESGVGAHELSDLEDGVRPLVSFQQHDATWQ